MKNFVQTGERLVFFPDHDVEPGELVIQGDLAGVAFSRYAVADGDGVVCDLTGVYELPKATGAWAQGEKLYWDADNGVATTAEGDNFIGHAADVATAEAETGMVRLKG